VDGGGGGAVQGGAGGDDRGAAAAVVEAGSGGVNTAEALRASSVAAGAVEPAAVAGQLKSVLQELEKWLAPPQRGALGALVLVALMLLLVDGSGVSAGWALVLQALPLAMCATSAPAASVAAAAAATVV
jgi:hypothetical protein